MLGDSLLQAAISTYKPIDVPGVLDTAQRYQENQNTLASQKNTLAEQQLKLGADQETTPLQTALVKEQAKNSLLYNAIAKATDAESWDANMRQLATKFPEAAQYIGRYTPVLQERLTSVYGNQPGGAVGVPNEAGLEQGPPAPGKVAAGAGGGLDYQFANTTPEQRGQALQKITAALDGLEQVGDSQGWEALKAKLHQMGVPMMDQIGAYSPIKAASIYQRLQPMRDYLQNRVMADSAGLPQPQPAPDVRAVGNSLFAVNPWQGTAKQIGSADKYASAGQDMMGNPVIYDTTTGQKVQSGGADGTFGFDDFAKRMTSLENATGDRTAKNPNSTATGNGQFTEATWLKTVKAARPELAENMTDKQILQLRKDPAMAQEMTAIYAQQNANILAANGQHVNATSLALAHRFGPQGALTLLAAQPDAKMSSILPADVIKANPGLANQTAGQYVQDLSKKAGLDTIGQQTGGGGMVGANVSPDLHGEDLMKALPQGLATQVKMLAEGRLQVPSGFALKSPYWQNMLRLAGQYDPDFDAVNYNGRYKTRQDFAPGGVVGKNITALNRVLGHAGNVLLPAFQALDNGQFPTWNQAANWIGKQLGQAAPTNAEQAVDAVASEARKVFVAQGGGNLTELENWKNNFPINGSPKQQIGAMKQFANLLDSQVDTLQDQWDKNMGRVNKADVHNFLSPGAKRALDTLRGLNPNQGYSGQGGGSAPAPAAAPGWVVKVVKK